MDIADAEVEIKRKGIVEFQLITSDDTTAHEVALTACFGQLVVELPGLVHRTDIAPFLLAEIPSHFGGHFPKGIAAVLVVPAP